MIIREEIFDNMIITEKKVNWMLSHGFVKLEDSEEYVILQKKIDDFECFDILINKHNSTVIVRLSSNKDGIKDFLTLIN